MSEARCAGGYSPPSFSFTFYFLFIYLFFLIHFAVHTYFHYIFIFFAFYIDRHNSQVSDVENRFSSNFLIFPNNLIQRNDLIPDTVYIEGSICSSLSALLKNLFFHYKKLIIQKRLFLYQLRDLVKSNAR